MMGFFGTLAYDFFRRKQYYDELAEAWEGLEEKSYLCEVIEQPGFYDGKVMYQIVKQSGKYMNDRIAEKQQELAVARAEAALKEQMQEKIQRQQAELTELKAQTELTKKQAELAEKQVAQQEKTLRESLDAQLKQQRESYEAQLKQQEQSMKERYEAERQLQEKAVKERYDCLLYTSRCV